MALVLASAPDSLDLGEWIQMALDHSQVPVQTEASRMNADATFGSARSTLLPRVTLSAGTGWIWSSMGSDPGGSGGSDGATYSAGISISQDILASGGSGWTSLRAASLGRDLADLQGQASILSLEQKVARAYYSVVEAAWLVRSAESSLARSDVLLQRIEMLFELGSGTAIDLLSARVQKTGDELALMECRQKLSSTLAELRLTAGVAGEESFCVDTSSVPRPLGLEEARRLPESTGANPSLSAAEVSVERARLSLSAASRSWMPSLSAGASWSWSGEEIELDNLGSEDSWGVSLSLSMPLFDGWATDSRVLSAEASLLEAEASLESSVDETETALGVARAALLSSIEGIELAELELEYAGQKLDLSHRSFELGGMDLAGLLDAEADLSAADAGRISAWMVCLNAEVDYLVLNGTSPRLGE
jgi:outer membrane protein